MGRMEHGAEKEVGGWWVIFVIVTRKFKHYELTNPFLPHVDYGDGSDFTAREPRGIRGNVRWQACYRNCKQCISYNADFSVRLHPSALNRFPERCHGDGHSSFPGIAPSAARTGKYNFISYTFDDNKKWFHASIIIVVGWKFFSLTCDLIVHDWDPCSFLSFHPRSCLESASMFLFVCKNKKIRSIKNSNECIYFVIKILLHILFFV